MKVFELLWEGGFVYMLPITIILIGLLVATWKAPRWVKTIGHIGLVIGLFGGTAGVIQISDEVVGSGIAALCVIAGGLKVMLIAPMYGLIVYFVSLICRIVVKPRI